MSISLNRATRNICSIVINRPEKRNALNSDLLHSLYDRLSEFNQDDSFKAAILSGSNGNFCAGLDLNEILSPATGLPELNWFRRSLWPNKPSLSEGKIVIAAIEGYAAGFGFELALKCDFRVMDRSARLGFMNRRFGIPIMNGGTVILPKLIGYARAAELIATGKAQTASEALQYGTITHLADIGCAMGRSINLARELVKFDQEPLIFDLKHQTFGNDCIHEQQMLDRERSEALKHLSRCSPFIAAQRFLAGEICRHGNMDMGNLIKPEPEVSL